MKLLLEEKAGKEIPFKVPYLIPAPRSHFGVIQLTHLYEYNPLDARELTKATFEGRRQLAKDCIIQVKHNKREPSTSSAPFYYPLKSDEKAYIPLTVSISI